LRDPAEREAHKDLKDSGEDGHGGLGATHEVARNDGHQRCLRHDTGKSAEESEEYLEENGGGDESKERHRDVADGKAGEGKAIESEAEALGQLACEQAAENRAESPTGFEETEGAWACMEDVACERDD